MLGIASRLRIYTIRIPFPIMNYTDGLAVLEKEIALWKKQLTRQMVVLPEWKLGFIDQARYRNCKITCDIIHIPRNFI